MIHYQIVFTADLANAVSVMAILRDKNVGPQGAAADGPAGGGFQFHGQGNTGPTVVAGYLVEIGDGCAAGTGQTLAFTGV